MKTPPSYRRRTSLQRRLTLAGGLSALIYSALFIAIAHSPSCQWIRCRLYPGHPQSWGRNLIQWFMAPGYAVEKGVDAYCVRSRLCGAWENSEIAVTVAEDLTARVTRGHVAGIGSDDVFNLHDRKSNTFAASSGTKMRFTVSADTPDGVFNLYFPGSPSGFYHKLTRRSQQYGLGAK